MILNNTKSFQIPIISIILLSLVFNFLAAPLAYAQTSLPTPTPTATADIKNVLGAAGSAIVGAGGTALLWGLNTVLTGTGIFLARFAVIGAFFFNYVIYFNLYKFADAVGTIKVGWDISRSVANMFFILILLIIAIATILRIQSHSAKQLLPKLIVIALLINFSLTFGLVVIDASNVLGKGFYEAIAPNGDIAASIMQGTAFSSIFNIVKASNDSNSLTSWVLPGILGGAVGGCAAGLPVAGIGCIGSGLIGAGVGLVGGFASWWKWGATKDFNDAASYFYPITIVNVVSVVITFIFIFGGILLAIRVAVLALLLALAPLAFISYVLPATEGRVWNVWWDKFLSHAFFLPAFMFLLYISILFSNSIALAATQGGVANPGFWIGLFMIVTMLISSLIIARMMGIYFAGSVLNWATASRKWLTGAVGGVAARNLVAPIGARLQQAQVMGRITRASPTLGYYAREAAGWLARRGQAPEQAENMARAALGQAESTWGSSFQKLNRAGKEAMLRNMTPEQRATFVNGLTGGQKTVAESILRSPQFSSAEQAKFDLERWRRQTPQLQQAQMAGWLTPGTAASPNKNYNPEAATEALRGMNDDEKAKMVDALKLADPVLAAAAENLIESRFSPKDAQNFKIARILRKPEPEQRAEWLAADPTTGLPNLSADDKEALLRKKDAKGQARFIGGFNDADPAEKAMKDAAENIIQTRFSGGEQNAYKEAVIENIASKSVGAIETAVGAMPVADLDQNLKILVRVGDEGKIASLLNTTTSASIKTKIGEIIRDRGLENKYMNSTAPRVFIENIQGVASVDPATHAPNPAYAPKLQEYFSKVDAKALRRNLSPEIIKQKEFVEDVLAGATIEDISLMTGDVRRAVAFKEGWESVLKLKPTDTNRERAESFAKEMDRRSNNVAAQELRDHIARSDALAIEMQKKATEMRKEGKSADAAAADAAAKELRSNLASDSPYAAVIKSILEGKAQPQTK